MRHHRALAAVLLSATYVVAAALPCPPELTYRGAPEAVAKRAAPDPHASMGHAHHHHAGGEAATKADTTTLKAPCRCGCGERGATVATGGKLGPAIAAIEEIALFASPGLPLEPASNTRHSVDLGEPDPIPI